MAIIQVAYGVPDDVYVGLETGELTRFGSVVRGRTGFKMHLKEVQIPKTEMSASSRIEQLTPINFEHFRSQTCSGDASYGSW
ncbi:hypothetical protein, partial [Trichococcus pasteurii]